MKKIFNYLMLSCIILAATLFVPKGAKAMNYDIEFNQIEYNDEFNSRKILNKYDYNLLNNIQIDSVLSVNASPTNPLVTNLKPITTTNTVLKAGSQSLEGYTYYIRSFYVTNTSNENYLTIVNSSATTFSSGSSFTSYTLTSGSSYTYSIFFKTISDRNRFIQDIDMQYENDTYFYYGSINQTRTYVQNNYNALWLYNGITGKTSGTITSNTQTVYSCPSSYDFNFYTSIYSQSYLDIRQLTNFYYSTNTCYLEQPIAIGSTYNYNFSALPDSDKQTIWNDLITTEQVEDKHYIYSYNFSDLLTDKSNIQIMFNIRLNFKDYTVFKFNTLWLNMEGTDSAKFTIDEIYYYNNNNEVSFNINQQYNGIANLQTLVVTNTKNEFPNFEGGSFNIINFITPNFTGMNFNLNFNVAYFTSGYVGQIISPEYKYRDCEWYEFMCHIGNGVAYITFNVPVLENFYSLFNYFKIMLSQTIDLFIEYKEITFFGSIVIAGIALHFIKRSVE